MENKFEILINLESIMEALKESNKEEITGYISEILKLDPTEQEVFQALKLLNKNYKTLLENEYNKEYKEMIQILKDALATNKNNKSYQLVEVLGGITQVDTVLGYRRVFEINKDSEGYYILIPDMKNLFSPNKIKKYFTENKDIENIKMIEDYNNKINKYNNDIKEAEEDNRMVEVKQKISNDTINVTAKFYYYNNGKEIIIPKKPKIN